MTDPLSISVGIIAILDITGRVIKYGLDFAGAPKEIRELKEKLESLESVLRRLMERCDNAQRSNPDETSPWLRGLWEVRGRRFDKNGVWVFEYRGIVAELKQAIEDAVAKLNPSREWKKNEAYQRARWHYKKDTFTEILTTISSCFATINAILALKNDETLSETLNLALKNDGTLSETLNLALKNDKTLSETLNLLKENNEYSTSTLAIIESRMSAIELNQRREEEREKKEAEQIEKQEIADWLSPLSFIAKQDELWTNCFKEVGEWLWQDESFHAWTEGRPWFLQCVGAPGVGKTVLSSILTHHLPSKSQGHGFPILSLYLNHKSTNVQTLPHLIGSLLKQLIQLDETFLISEELKALFKMARRLKLEPKTQQIHKILVTELDRYDRFYFVVDGFDEIPLRDRLTLLQELTKLRSEKGSLVITTRPISEEPGTYICNGCDKESKLAFHCKICNKGNYDLCYDCKRKGLWCHNRLHPLTEPYGLIEVAVKIPSTDIENYVRWEVGVEVGDGKPTFIDDRDTAIDNPFTTPFQDLCQTDPNLPEQIVAEVAKKANGRFLFARLYMDSLKSKSNLRMLRKALESFPDNINDIYKEAMQRIEAQEPEERKIAHKILGMITHARRPLSLQELQHALATADLQYEEDETENGLFDGIVKPKTIFGSTSALVHEEDNQVRLVHRSLEDYLHIAGNDKKWFPTADVEIANACMIYLNLVLPRKFCDDEYFIAKKRDFPFLQYASQFWGDHVRDASQNPEHAADIQKAALQLIEDPQRMSACMQAAWLTNPGGHDTWDVWRNIDRLHICAWYGLSSIISAMQPDNSMVDRVEPKYGQTPLMYACRKGHSSVVRQLLQLGASQQKVSARGRTALFETILGHHSSNTSSLSGKLSKHCEVVELLVCEMPRDLNINMTHGQEFDRTALMLAARLGHLEMIEILLKREDINIDLQDLNGMTAVYLAARENHYHIVQLLLDAQASIDIVDFHAGRSPLRCAAERNLHDMVDLLLQYNADPALKDREGGTAMLRAVNRGAKLAFEKMMEYPIDLYCADEDGQSLLHGAARNGYHEIARLLLEDRSPGAKGLCPGIRDSYNMTPLHDASRYGDVAVLSVLLEHGADASLKDKFERTPFMVAWQYGHESIMRVLADSGNEPQPIVSLIEEQLPVWSMARRGLTDLVAHAIVTRGHDLHILEPCTENSPLQCAVEDNELDILSMLLETGELPVNKPNRFGRTTLHVAALEGDYSATKCLIDHGANVDLKDRWMDEALVLAQSNQHLEVMLALIEANAMVDKKKIHVKTLFFFAVEQQNVAATRILIEKHGVDRSIQNNDGLRAEQIATAAEDIEMILLLRSASTVSFMDATTTGPGSKELDNKKIPFRPFRSRPIAS